MILPLIKIKDFTNYDQFDKINEELDEFAKSETHTEEEISEALDLIQATLTYITHEYTKAEIEEAVKLHYDKLIGRGHKLKGVLNISLEDKK